MIKKRALFILLTCITLLLAAVACGTIETADNDSNGRGKDQPPSPTDQSSPSVSNVAVSNITIHSAIVTRTTNEPATSQVKYGLTSDLGSTTTLDTTLVTAHSVTLTGLTSGDLYHIEPASRDAGGNESSSTHQTFYAGLPQDLAIGASAQNSNQRVTVRSASRVSSYTSGSGYTETAGAGNIFVIVDLCVENIGDTGFYALDSRLTISDSQGVKHYMDSYQGDDKFNSASLQPNQRTQGKVLFEVPATATGFEIAYDFGIPTPNPATWRLS